MNSARLARYGWLATTAILALALVIASWTSYRAARDAATALNRGQADLLQGAVREAFLQRSGPLGDAGLQEILDAQQDAGLRYIATFDSTGAIAASAGTAVLPLTRPLPPQQPGAATQQSDGRVRILMPRPPTRTELALQDSLRRAGRAPQRGGGPGRRIVLLEMEPLLAREIQSRAAGSLALALAGASILTLAAVLFWRTSEKYQHALLRIEEQRRLTLLGEMSAVLAHEIRNPLASLKGNAQLLAEKLAGGTRERARAERVIAEAARLEALTSDLLDFARSAPLRVEAVDPVALVRTSAADIAEDAFEIDATTAPSSWPLDPARVRQSLVNVLQNAQQASPQEARPHVRVLQQDGRLVYEVRDFGAGLPPGTEHRIFDPFFTTRTNGTGLGLAVAKRVAEAHGGTVTARNHEQGGAVFRIELARTGH